LTQKPKKPTGFRCGYIWFTVCIRDFIFGQVHACFDHFVISVKPTIQKKRQTTTDTSFIEQTNYLNATL
jgi:hypothetical protein